MRPVGLAPAPPALTHLFRAVLVLIVCSNARHGQQAAPLLCACHVLTCPACRTPACLLALRPNGGVAQLIRWALWPALAHKAVLGMRAQPTMLGCPGLTDPGLMRPQSFLSSLAPLLCLQARACACQLSRRQAYEAPVDVVEGTQSKSWCPYAQVLSTGSDTIVARSLALNMLSFTAGQARSSVSAGDTQAVLRGNQGRSKASKQSSRLGSPAGANS